MQRLLRNGQYTALALHTRIISPEAPTLGIGDRDAHRAWWCFMIPSDNRGYLLPEGAVIKNHPVRSLVITTQHTAARAV